MVAARVARYLRTDADEAAGWPLRGDGISDRLHPITVKAARPGGPCRLAVAYACLGTCTVHSGCAQWHVSSVKDFASSQTVPQYFLPSGAMQLHAGRSHFLAVDIGISFLIGARTEQGGC